MNTQRLASRLFLKLSVLVITLAVFCVPSFASGWSTSGVKILTPAGTQFTITGINWYGFETTMYVAHGLYDQDYTYILNEVKQDGYSTVRIPFSSDMWENDPTPSKSHVSACPSCAGKNSRDILAMIVNYAGSIGLHVILDNHRSEAGNSAEKNGLWYTSTYPEQNWLSDWVHVEDWVHGIQQTEGATDTVTVNYIAADGYPTVLGFDLRNEPHTPSRTAYLAASTWGTGDGIDPTVNPNPNPFAPACVANSTCVDWRLAAERAGDGVFGEAAKNGWTYPLIFVEGISEYPTATGTAANGPYDSYWWGGQLQGVNGNSANNPGAPVVLNVGGNATSLGAAVSSQLVYAAHDYGPATYVQSWFNSSTCYVSGCSSSSLADVWNQHWAYINAGNVNPIWGGGNFPWSNTGATAYTETPEWVGEFGTGNSSSDDLLQWQSFAGAMVYGPGELHQ